MCAFIFEALYELQSLLNSFKLLRIETRPSLRRVIAHIEESLVLFGLTKCAILFLLRHSSLRVPHEPVDPSRQVHLMDIDADYSVTWAIALIVMLLGSAGAFSWWRNGAQVHRGYEPLLPTIPLLSFLFLLSLAF